MNYCNLLFKCLFVSPSHIPSREVHPCLEQPCTDFSTACIFILFFCFIVYCMLWDRPQKAPTLRQSQLQTSQVNIWLQHNKFEHCFYYSWARKECNCTSEKCDCPNLHKIQYVVSHLSWELMQLGGWGVQWGRKVD